MVAAHLMGHAHPMAPNHATSGQSPRSRRTSIDSPGTPRSPDRSAPTSQRRGSHGAASSRSRRASSARNDADSGSSGSHVRPEPHAAQQSRLGAAYVREEPPVAAEAEWAGSESGALD